jgi:nucleoside-diphosphate-sugar epimerase
LRAAHAAKVTRFVFVSTIGVHGNATHGTPFRESDTPAPHTIYAETKWAAEQQVVAFCTAHGMEWCVIRPPLVYGPKAPGNIGTLQKLIRLGVPLPFRNSDNRRSLIAVEYLGAVLQWAATAPKAANRLFLVSDGIDRSTGGLLQTLAAQMGTRVRLFPFPQKILRFVAGKRFAPLWDDLQIDATAIHTAMRDAP